MQAIKRALQLLTRRPRVRREGARLPHEALHVLLEPLLSLAAVRGYLYV